MHFGLLLENIFVKAMLLLSISQIGFLLVSTTLDCYTRNILDMLEWYHVPWLFFKVSLIIFSGSKYLQGVSLQCDQVVVVCIFSSDGD